jgi:hypothetical protein
MKCIYKRKLLLILLLILITFRSFNLPSYSYSKLVSKTNSEKFLFIEYGNHAVPVLLQRIHFDIEYELGSDSNSIITIYLAWIFITNFIKLKVLLLDRRKLIIALMTSYFEGSKYKYSIFVSE